MVIELLSRGNDSYEDGRRINARNAPSGSFRVTTMYNWPILFHDLQGAICYLIRRGPIWYELEQKSVHGDWETLISRADSRKRPHSIGEDRS